MDEPHPGAIASTGPALVPTVASIYSEYATRALNLVLASVALVVLAPVPGWTMASEVSAF